MPLAAVKGGDIHFETSGDGQPVVMLLPQSSGPVGTAPFLSGLAETFQVIRYDQRGTGQSAPPPSPDAVSMTDRAAEVIGLLDALELPKAHLCCHSTGCGIGLAVASQHPDRVARLVLTTPWSYGDAHLTTMQELRIAAARALDPYRYAWFNASLLFPPDYRREHAATFEQLAQQARDNPQDADQIAARLHAILAFDSRPITPTLACPTLVISAEDDQLMPAWFGREMAESLPNAELNVMDAGGHMLPETRCTELVAAVTGFLSA